MSKDKPKKKTVAGKTAFASAVDRSNELSADKIEMKRKRLLARVAGYVASGIVTAPSPSTATVPGLVSASVEIAEEILKQVGL